MWGDDDDDDDGDSGDGGDEEDGGGDGDGTSSLIGHTLCPARIYDVGDLSERLSMN